MASITPRASGFWEDSIRTGMPSNYFPDDEEEDIDVEQQQLISDPELIDDGRTRLDKTIDRIGMGSYQWTLLSLCGFGWMADNMWIQAIAIILPRVQRHYDVSDAYIGTLSSSMFAGMMFGAIGWGTCSDLMGRSAAFNATLFFTSLFGLLASFANSFPALCVLLFFLGSSVGGSMPTDGTLLLEHMPRGKQYLVTALSVFFSFGAVLSAIVALLVVPRHSCLASTTCDVEVNNRGWKYLLTALGLITLSMFLARIVFFRLHESPRYLVHAGRPQEALESLQLISRFNGSDLSLDLDDVDDRRPVEDRRVSPLRPETLDKETDHPSSTTVFDADTSQSYDPSPYRQSVHSEEILRSDPSSTLTDYHATGESNSTLESHSYSSPTEERLSRSQTPRSSDLPSPKPFFHDVHKEVGLPPSLSPRRGSRSTSPPNREPPHLRSPRPRPPLSRNRRLSSASTRSHRRSSFYERKKACSRLPRWLRKPLWAWLDRMSMVLSPEWLRTTLLVWSAWCAMSLAYTMFNVFLPKLLESGPVEESIQKMKSLEDSLWDVVIFTIGGCPGAILGAYMVESPLGRKWSLAGSTFITAFFCMVFGGVTSSWAVRASTVGVSLSATTMWAVLYGWTPEIFGTKVRGTACGIASALSRIGGMIAPMLGGMLLMLDRSFPVYASVVIFVIAGICVLLLREGENRRTSSGRVVVH